jgi:hypothetical protein
MRTEQDAMMVVRADLCERLEALQRIVAARPQRDCSEAVAGIRCLAAAYGLVPVARLAEALERAMQRTDSAGTCQSALYVDRLYDAIGCERLDDAASEAMIASVSVRFA